MSTNTLLSSLKKDFYNKSYFNKSSRIISAENNSSKPPQIGENNSDVNSQADLYEGDLVDGKKNGTGKMIYTNGDIYYGEWKDDYVENGTSISANGNKIYKGEFVDRTLYNGTLVEIESNGKKYITEYKDGEKGRKKEIK